VLKGKENQTQSRDISPRSPRMTSPRLPAPSEYMARSIISRRKSARVSGGRMGLKPKVLGWRVAAVAGVVSRHRREASGSSNQETRAGWWGPPEPLLSGGSACRMC
jgi:hypothetical protein